MYQFVKNLFLYFEITCIYFLLPLVCSFLDTFYGIKHLKFVTTYFLMYLCPSLMSPRDHLK